MIIRQAVAAIAAIILTAVAPCAWTADSIRFAVGTFWAPPYAEFDRERMTGGILFDLASALGRVTQREIVQVPLPRKRIEKAASEGIIDIHCYFNPVWSENRESYNWSSPMFDIPDVLVAHHSVAKISTVSAIPDGATIGTVLGYRYPELESDFQNGRLKRDDTADQESVLKKVVAKRNLYGVSNLRAAAWFKRTANNTLATWQLVVNQLDFYCAVPNKSSIPAHELLEALEILKREGSIRQILRNYQ